MEQAKRIADGVWGVETVVGVGLGVHLPLRMTVLRVDGGLWLVSPIAIDDALADELSALGEVHALVAPNLLHHAHVEAAKRRYPEARLLGAPGLAAKRPALPWDGAVDTGSLAGDLQGRRIEGADKLSEVVLWHVPSATLVVTDAVFNIPEARGMSWLVLEYLDLGVRSASNPDALGCALAAMHQCRSNQFGWSRNNTIGSTPQINTRSDDWVSFWRTHRLGFQLRLALENGYRGRLQQLGERLLECVEQFFTGYQPYPSLLHGDLWCGNYAYTGAGEPVLFDPAVYFGDREADLAMTELFGGFPQRFYSAYRHEYQLDSGYNTRKILYNLYHVLNHLNLFGGSYRQQAEQMMNALLAEIR